MICRRATAAEILPLRHEVLRAGLPRNAAVFQGDDDPQTRHAAALDEDRVVACLSIMLNPLDRRPACQLRGMAVAADRRGQGVGREVLAFALEDLHGNAVSDLIWCNARTEAVGFYRKEGWQVISDEFEIEGVGPHFRMSRGI